MKKILLPLLLIVVALFVYQPTTPKNPYPVSESDAIALVKDHYPEFQAYPTSNLPPKSIEVINTEDGWRIGMYVEGSGVRGILKANCFLVTKTGTVTETGLFQGEGPAQNINLVTCTPKE